MRSATTVWNRGMPTTLVGAMSQHADDVVIRRHTGPKIRGIAHSDDDSEKLNQHRSLGACRVPKMLKRASVAPLIPCRLIRRRFAASLSVQDLRTAVEGLERARIFSPDAQFLHKCLSILSAARFSSVQLPKLNAEPKDTGRGQQRVNRRCNDSTLPWVHFA